ncbi:MAG TPA: glycoside hydrolase family 43 protein, partial [Fodinibius sp.]|nr:glycoside hydrolase family 43 protein [Fodinibius sp.]
MDYKPCSFTNPVTQGQDPWVTKKDGFYYYIESRGGGLYVSKSEDLTELKSNAQKVWTQPDSGWNQSSLWAPELHYLDGKWYIYYAAGESGPPFIHQRSGVLESVADDPLGEYTDVGQLYTGDNIETKEDNKWSIDLTVLTYQNQRYAIWSGWEENENTDATPQHLYIAEMENPRTISSNRVKISSPEEPWETGTELAINEGPQILRNERGEVFIIYSASESWLPAYNLGQLRLTGDDPVNPDHWQKKGPVFEGTESVHGVGHASFTTSPDGSEHWIAYHTKVSPEPGWKRVVHLQS